MSDEIKKIVKDTLVGKPEEEVQTFEKCLRLVGSNRTRKDQELGFALLARMVIKCSPPTLRAVQSRLANRFAQISDHFQLSGSLFVREVLVRNPQAGELHSPLVFKIILNSIDTAVQSSDPTIRGLAAELFALRISTQNFTLLLNTLDILLSQQKIKKVTNDVLQLSTLGVSSFQTSLISLLFEILALSLGYATKPGLLVDRKEIIRVIELGIKKPETRPFAFGCLRSTCLNTKYSMIPMIGRIVSSLVSELDTPDVELIKTLAFISKCFGPVTATLHKHFYVIFTALKHPLHEQDYAEYAASLLANIIESAASLIKPEVFVTVQKAVCESAIMYPDHSVYLQLLSSFLALNNEYVPSPLHVARSVSYRSRSTSEFAHRLRTICNVASRPRTADIANVKAKKTLILNEEKVIDAVITDLTELADVDVVEIVEEEEEDVAEDVEIQAVENVEEAKVEEVKEVVEPRKKKNSESTSAPLVKKKKKMIHDVKTDLLEGEASVDDILNLFDPS
uniref:Uncharacterized protein n=1 Tax=Caenorhabditis japonica TaxID=281687 RepID=A0A8R1HJZ5_CAEJA